MKLGLATLAALLLVLAAGYSAEADARRTRRPLDLPSGGLGIAYDDEDMPEMIHFYDEAYEGEAFFFCLDRSSSMLGHQRWGILKQEVSQALRSLTPEAEFGLVAFNDSVAVFREQPAHAHEGNRRVAREWLDGLVPYGSTCITAGAIKALEISRQSTKRRKIMIVVGDGMPACQGIETSEVALEEITLANYEHVPIHTVLVGPGEGTPFMQDLADLNSGRFVHIAHQDGPPVP